MRNTSEQRKKKAMRVYDSVCTRYRINQDSPKKEQLRQMVDIGMNIQKSIDEKTDKIRSEIYDEICYYVNIDKATWANLVLLNSKKFTMKDSLKEKWKDKVNNSLYYVNLRNSFVNNELTTCDEHIKIPTEGSVSFTDDYTTDEQVDELFKKATEIKTEIDEVLTSDYKDLIVAVGYITDFKLTGTKFKQFVKIKLYKDGVPLETSKSKINALVNKIDELWQIEETYGYNEFEEKLKAKGFIIQKISNE